MEFSPLSYSQVPKTSNLLIDYLSHYERAQSFYNESPFEHATYTRLASHLRGNGADRAKLAEILLRQNQAFGSGEETFQNIRSLTSPDVFAVVTGQQVGLFSGPAFTLYKALTAIRLSQALTTQGVKTVPIFWLATEDHDLEEVAAANVFDDDFELVRLADEGARPAPRSPVGRIKLTQQVAEALDRLESLLPPTDARQHMLEDLRTAYRPGVTWGQAFGKLLARLFGRFGVVLLDPLDEEIHRMSVPIYHQALRRAGELRAKLQERSQMLMKAGYHAQVHIAEESTLVFAERDGNRFPLHQREGAMDKEFFTTDGRGFSIADLEREVNDHPIGFSPNVLLRPLVQDLLLPTLASVAGPSELAYLGQAAILYGAFGRAMPAIFPRAGFTLMDHRIERWMEKYNVRVEDVWQGEEHLGRRIAAGALAEGWAERFDQAEQDLQRLLERLRTDVESLDPTLLDALKHAEEKIKFQIERLRGKMTRAALSRSEVLERHKQTLLRAITPDKDLQERVVSGVWFLGKAGYPLLDSLLDQIPTDSSDHRVLTF
jgi:bacillithiol synthase